MTGTKDRKDKLPSDLDAELQEQEHETHETAAPEERPEAGAEGEPPVPGKRRRAQAEIKGVNGVVYSAIYLAGMMMLFVSERMVVESTTLRIALGCVAAAVILAAVVGRLLRRGKLPVAARGVEGRILLCYLAGVAAVLLYLAQADFAMDRLRPMFDQDRGANRYAGALGALWPVVWVCSMLTLALMELSYGPMNLRRTMEPTRVFRSARSGLVVSISICIVFLVNFICAEFDKKIDLSYFKTTHPSESSVKMVQNLSSPVQVVLFYPGANEVQELVEGYFQELAGASKQLTVKVMDHALELQAAKKYAVSDNGYVVLVKGTQNRQIQIGTKLERAKRKLKKLDGEFQQAFMKLSRGQKVAYFTVGHEERKRRLRDRKRGSSVADMRQWLEKLNFQIKDLGLGEGLSSGVPGDATVVIVAGPRKPFMEAEARSLVKYLEGGGRAMMFFDPEAGESFADLLGPFGLKLTTERLANDRRYYPATRTLADRHFIITQSYSSHPSVSTLSQKSAFLGTILPGAGYLEEIPSTHKGQKPRVQFTMHSLASSWNDKNKNFVFDAKSEKRKAYELAAVVTQAATGKKAKTGKKSKDTQMRLLVVADSDLVSDRAFRNPGNGYLFIDGLKWLAGEEQYIGEVSSEEDVRIRHTQKGDKVWFYLSIFAVPIVVLAGGLAYIRRRRSKP